ncbi:MAG: glycosyltransferase family protein [Bacteroidetes bacterium]|nr:glycosyltransferase family protein [Bacteroidota bacterium]
MNPLIFIQARMGSTRLPGKVLKPIGGKLQLQHLIDRLGVYTGRGQVVVVTSDKKTDDAIEKFCVEQEIKFFRGSEEDVLDRFYKAAKKFGASSNTTIVRITADCPLHHESVIRFALDEFARHELDYFTNSFAPHFEDGCDTEVFRYSVLEQTWKEADLQSQREHVTPYMKDSGKFLAGYKKYDPRYCFKLSVDTPEDHEAIENIFKTLAPSADFTITQVVDLILRDPSIIAANKKSVINAGYARSLSEDKKIK